MASVEQALADVLAYARDNRHGYELGYHSSSAMGTGTDCSGLVRLYAAKLAGVGVDSFPNFSTRTERRVLTGRGWHAIAFSLAKARRGDVLLTEPNGHTVIYLGNSRILGAEGDWDGRRGDGSGTEVCERSYYAYRYNWILRPPTGAAGEEDEVTDADIEKIAKRVWQYKNKSMNGNDDAYQLQTDIHTQLMRTDAAGHDNPKGHDLYGRILIIEHNLSLVMAKLGIVDWYRENADKVGKDAPDFDEEVAGFEAGK